MFRGLIGRRDALYESLTRLVRRKDALRSIDREPAYVGKRIVERLSKQSKFPSERGCAHQPVVGIDRNAEADPVKAMDRMLADGRHSSGLHIGGRAHLERDLLIENVRREVAEHLAPAFVLLNVGDDRDAMTDPIRAAHLHGFPDGLAALGLAGMNRVVRTLPA